MSPRLLYLLTAVRRPHPLTLERDRAAARRAATRMFIGLPPVTAPHRRVTLALQRLRDHAERDARVRMTELRATG